MQLGPRKIDDSHVCVDCFQVSESGGMGIWSAVRVCGFPLARQYGTKVSYL